VFSSFIFVTVNSQPFKSGLFHFLGVLSIDSTTERLRTAKNYTYMLAGVVYCIRVLSVEHLLPSTKRNEQTEEHQKRFLEHREKYLADGSYSPMSEALSILAYGKFVALSAGNSGSTTWSSNKQTFYLHGKPIHLDLFRKMAQDLVAEVEEKLWSELLWFTGNKRFTVPLERLVDDISLEQRGVSFVQHPDNGLADKLKWMLTKSEKPEHRRDFYSRNGKWNKNCVKRYLRAAERFKILLLVCVHITSGQPGRGSEITTMRFKNGLLQDRNIYIIDGRVMTVSRYHKSQSQWDKPKIVPRFLPPRLSQVMVLYLAYVQPFEEYLNVQVLKGGISEYIWADNQGPWGTERLTRALKRETGKRIGVELHTLDYRHAAVGIGREVVGAQFSKGYQDEVGEVDEPEVDDDGEDAIELQAARTTNMGISNYSVPIDIIKHLSNRSIDIFRPLSTLWHQFLGLDEKQSPQQLPWMNRADRGQKRTRQERGSVNEPGVRVVQQDHQKELKIRKAMARVFGRADVGFLSVEQEQALHAVIDGQTPLVVVLPTGGGKSLLFTVPACMENTGVTVVIVPYRALIQDLISRVHTAGLECQEWRPGQGSPACIMVVSADIAGDITSSGNFISHAHMLCGKGLLRRVVIDECHLTITSSDWRPTMALLKNLRLIPCPIILLTATLPPVRQGELQRSMLIEQATFIRASTVRPNTRYYVVLCGQGKLIETALQRCQSQQPLLLQRGEKGVVYCRSKQQCEAIAQELNCQYYHAGDDNRDEKRLHWLSTGGLITATSALGTGVNYSKIVYILHVGMPYGMIEFAQATGRGGRAGERVDSVVLIEKGAVERLMKQKTEDIDVQAMGTFLIGDGCRRAWMSSYLDGKRIECGDINGAACDRCGEGAREWHDNQQQASREWQVVEELFTEAQHSCIICISQFEERQIYEGHRTMDCQYASEVDKLRDYVKDGGGGHSCWRCWVSQKYCATGESVDNPCQWPNVVIPLAWVAFWSAGGPGLFRALGYDAGDLGTRHRSSVQSRNFGIWLGKRHRERVWGEFFSNAMVVAIHTVFAIKGMPHRLSRIE
jgi:superfamily II DNA helicase RecQ